MALRLRIPAVQAVTLFPLIAGCIVTSQDCADSRSEIVVVVYWLLMFWTAGRRRDT